jgi:hypothetical protein
MPGEFYIEGKKEKIDISGLVAAAIELEDKLDSIVVYRGRTTDDGAADGSTLICADLTTKPDYDGNLVVICSGDFSGKSSQITDDTTGGIVTPFVNFGGKIVANVKFAVLSINVNSFEIAALKAILNDSDHGLAALKAQGDALNTGLLEFQGMVYLDASLGVPGTDFPIGTPGIPVSNLADARAICTARKTNVIHVKGDITLDANMTGYVFVGDGDFNGVTSLNLNGKRVHTSAFRNLAISGSCMSGDYAYFFNCLLSSGSAIGGLLDDCAIELDVTALVELDSLNCAWGTGGSGTLRMAADALAFLKGVSGNLIVADVAAGNIITVQCDNARVQLMNSCVGGVITIYGNASIIDGSAGSTVNNSTINQAIQTTVNGVKADTDKLSNVVTTNTYVHPNAITEQDGYIFAAAIQKVSIRFDMSGLVQKTTVREKEQVDGANYREISAKVFPDDFDAGCQEVVIDYVQANALYKITFQSAVLEGGVVNVPYRIITQDLS